MKQFNIFGGIDEMELIENEFKRKTEKNGIQIEELSGGCSSELQSDPAEIQTLHTEWRGENRENSCCIGCCKELSECAFCNKEKSNQFN